VKCNLRRVAGERVLRAKGFGEKGEGRKGNRVARGLRN